MQEPEDIMYEIVVRGTMEFEYTTYVTDVKSEQEATEQAVARALDAYPGDMHTHSRVATATEIVYKF